VPELTFNPLYRKHTPVLPESLHSKTYPKIDQPS